MSPNVSWNLCRIGPFRRSIIAVTDENSRILLLAQKIVEQLECPEQFGKSLKKTIINNIDLCNRGLFKKKLYLGLSLIFLSTILKMYNSFNVWFKWETTV